MAEHKHATLRIADKCPTCGVQSLFIGTGGHLTCSSLQCKEPGVTRGWERRVAAAVTVEMERCTEVFAFCIASLHADAQEKVMRNAIARGVPPTPEPPAAQEE